WLYVTSFRYGRCAPRQNAGRPVLVRSAVDKPGTPYARPTPAVRFPLIGRLAGSVDVKVCKTLYRCLLGGGWNRELLPERLGQAGEAELSRSEGKRLGGKDARSQRGASRERGSRSSR